MVEDSVNLKFFRTTSELLAIMFDINIPSDDIIEDIMSRKVSYLVENSKEVLDYQETFKQGLEELSVEIEKKEIPQRKLVNIRLTNKRYLKQILDFIYTATNLRSLNFKLDHVKRYKVEHIAFRITPNLDLVSSAAANLIVYDIIKYSFVKFL